MLPSLSICAVVRWGSQLKPKDNLGGSCSRLCQLGPSVHVGGNKLMEMTRKTEVSGSTSDASTLGSTGSSLIIVVCGDVTLSPSPCSKEVR